MGFSLISVQFVSVWRLASYICIFFLLYKNSTYFILLSKVWERAEEFLPERFDLEEPVPNETNTDFRWAALAFSGKKEAAFDRRVAF